MDYQLTVRTRPGAPGAATPETEPPPAPAARPVGAYLPQSQRLMRGLTPGLDIGPYRLGERLGVGGMGVVHRAQDRLTGEEVAMKFLVSSDERRNQDALARFEEEARILGRLQHPAIVQVRDLSRSGQYEYLVMDLFLGPHGKPVNHGDYSRAFGAANGRLDSEDLQQIFAALLEAIHYAHDHGVVHCDLKPANILLHCIGKERDRWHAHLKLTDFGVARVVGEARVHESVTQSVHRAARDQATATEDVLALLGTYEYMSPEQRRGEPATPRSDLYAIGLMMFRLLTGQQEPGLRRPSELAPGTARAWDEIIPRAMREKPDQRFPDADAMLKAVLAVST